MEAFGESAATWLEDTPMAVITALYGQLPRLRARAKLGRITGVRVALSNGRTDYERELRKQANGSTVSAPGAVPAGAGVAVRRVVKKKAMA